MKDLYQETTAAIIEQLEAGAIPWVKSWDTGDYFPHNAISRRAYSGINVLILMLKAHARGYPSPRWLTFKQALAAGGCVRKGEKGTGIIFVKAMTFHEDGKDPRRSTMLRAFSVFNAAQIDGLPAPEPTPELPPSNVDEFVVKTGARVFIGPNEPCYVPSLDQVMMPPRVSFHGDEHYHATLLHELCHWSGAKHRLDRDMTGRFGTQSYAAEELVAELGAAFLCAHLGVKGELRHAGYIGNWLQLLRSDPKAIFTASAKASQAADYLRAFSSPAQLVED